MWSKIKSGFNTCPDVFLDSNGFYPHMSPTMPIHMVIMYYMYHVTLRQGVIEIDKPLELEIIWYRYDMKPKTTLRLLGKHLSFTHQTRVKYVIHQNDKMLNRTRIQSLSTARLINPSKHKHVCTWGDRGSGPPLKNHKNIGFLSNTGPGLRN